MKLVQGLDQKTLMVLSGIFSSVNFAYKIVEMTISKKVQILYKNVRKTKEKWQTYRLEKKEGYIEGWG